MMPTTTELKKSKQPAEPSSKAVANAAVAAHVRERLSPRAGMSGEAIRNVAAAMNGLLADTFALYFKTKNFHWHMSGPHFRDYHLLLDDQGDQIFAMTDPLAERVRKIGGKTLHSVGEIARTQRVLDNDADYVEPATMLAELRDDNEQLAARMREAHATCEDCGDLASTSLLEDYIDETERRGWFLFEASRHGNPDGH